MTTELGPAYIEPGGAQLKGVWHGYPFALGDQVERYITSQFGAWEPFRQARGWGSHQGIDLHAAPGTPIHALAPGVVEQAGRNGFYPVAGIYVQIQHEGGIDSQYLHLSGVSVAVGEHVERGQLIGVSGATSSPTYEPGMAPHLHLNVKRDGVSIDPAGVIVRELAVPTAPLMLDRDTLLEYAVSEFWLSGASHGGTMSRGAPEFAGYEEDDKTERWTIRLQRPVAERPAS